MRKIATKILIAIGATTILLSVFLLYQVYTLTNRHLRKAAEQNASMALKFDVAIRDYIAKYVRPAMYELMGKDAFIPELMSTSYVARTIFEDVRKDFPDFIIKFSSDNPRNPANQAGLEELKAIKYFNDNPQLQGWEGEISINDKPYFAKFSAMRMEVTCLRCHGDPENAPASLLKRYGSTAGFHRPLGKVIGMDTVAIPIVKITEQLWSDLKQSFFLITLGLLLFFLSIICLTRFLVTNRLSSITQHFLTAAQQSNYQKITPIEIKGNDEIRDLAVSFNSLCHRLRNFYSSLETQVKDRTQELADKNEQMEREIEERKRTEAALAKNEQLLNATGRMAKVGGWEVELDPLEVRWTEETYRIHEVPLDYKPHLDEAINFFHPEDRPGLEQAINRAIEDGEPFDREMRFITAKGKHLWTRSMCKPHIEDHKVVKLSGTFQDITERKQAEDQVKASLKVKEVLLSEIHHRVKNNMQVIISLLRLQADKIDDKKYADFFRENEVRIRSMSLIHEQLYQTEDLANINFREYIKTLSNELFISYVVDPNKIKLNVVIEDIAFDLENAMPCGLIINELVSNSIKYAFPEGREGMINIELRAVNEDELELTVSDNGVGIPEELDIRNADTMGLYLVRVLVEHQLGGKITLNITQGTQFNIKFKRATYKLRM